MTPSSSNDRALRAAVTATFERLAFIVADPEVTPEQSALPVAAGCRVHFRGRISGVLEAEAYGAVLAETAGNMLAAEGGTTPAEELSAFAEAMNVVCGNALPALCGVQAVFDLSAPEARPGLAIRRRDGEDILARASVGMGEGRVDVVIRQHG